MAVAVYLVLFLAFIGHSNALYCICKDGSDSALQKTLDYACGAGADCSPILQNGACYNPNTVKDHCSYAVNSYFQKKGQASGTCDFSGTATTSASPPSNVPSTCNYPSSASTSTTPTPTTGGTTPTTTPTTGTTPTTTPTTGTTTPTTGTTPTTTGTSPTVFGGATGLGPTGSGTGINDSGSLALHKTTNLFFTLWVSLSSCLILVVALLWG
ncbi:hypothetical protein ACOSP7_017896 [Xanthoceras sorbifolium]